MLSQIHIPREKLETTFVPADHFLHILKEIFKKHEIMSPVSFLAVHSKRGSFHTHGSALCISFYLVIPREHPPMLLSFNALSLFSKLSKMSWHGHKHSLLNHSLNDKLI